MTNSTINSWVFIAVDLAARHTPASLDKIIGAADAINHDIPSHYELQTAIGWLMQEGLIYCRGKDYSLTPRGNDLVAQIKLRTAKLFDAWDLLKQEFISAKAPVELADISLDEWQQAYDTYYNRASKFVR